MKNRQTEFISKRSDLHNCGVARGINRNSKNTENPLNRTQFKHRATDIARCENMKRERRNSLEHAERNKRQQETHAGYHETEVGDDRQNKRVLLGDL